MILLWHLSLPPASRVPAAMEPLGSAPPIGPRALGTPKPSPYRARVHARPSFTGGTRKQPVRHCALSLPHWPVSMSSSRGWQGSTQAHASAVPILSAGLDFGEKLPDPVDVFFWLLGMRTDLGPARVRNQTMHLLGHASGVDVVVSRHHQGRRPNPLEALLAHAQGQIWAIEEGVDRVPHHVGEVLRRHRFQRLPVLGIVLGPLWRKRGKTVVGVERIHHGF